jgi:hypothetical protein
MSATGPLPVSLAIVAVVAFLAWLLNDEATIGE